MNALTIICFACLVAYASASLIGARLVSEGPTTLIGASGVVGPNGAAGPAGVVTGNGAVGPNGLASGIHGGIIAAPGVVGGLGLGLGLGLSRAVAPIAWAPAAVSLAWADAHSDGQWRGEGLWESQDHGPW